MLSLDDALFLKHFCLTCYTGTSLFFLHRASATHSVTNITPLLPFVSFLCTAVRTPGGCYLYAVYVSFYHCFSMYSSPTTAASTPHIVLKSRPCTTLWCILLFVHVVLVTTSRFSLSSPQSLAPPPAHRWGGGGRDYLLYSPLFFPTE